MRSRTRKKALAISRDALRRVLEEFGPPGDSRIHPTTHRIPLVPSCFIVDGR